MNNQFSYLTQKQQIHSACLDNHWCTFEAVDNISIKIQIAYLCCVSIYAVIISYYIYRLLRYYKKSDSYKQLFGIVYVIVFSLLSLWAIFSITKTIINISIYYKYMTEPIETYIQNQDIVISAGVFEMFDSLSALSLILLLFIIPSQWLKFVLDHCKDDQRDEVQNMDLHLRKKIQIYYKGLKIIKIYIVIRMFSVIFFALQPYMIANKQFGCLMPKINSIYLISQASVLFILYILGFLIILQMHNKKLFQISNSDYLHIRREYLLLLLVLVMRIFYHSFLRFTTFYQYEPKINCSDTIQWHKVIRTVLLSIDHGFMHLTSAAIVIYVYKPILGNKHKKNESLLGSGDNTQYLQGRSNE